MKMTFSSLRLGIVIVCGTVATSGALLAAESAAGKLKAAAPNTWVQLAQEKTGGRTSPIMIYDARSKRFVLSAGAGGSHWDSEVFDLASGTWMNFYPKNAPYKKASGPTEAPGLGRTRPNVGPLKADKNGVLRVIRRSHIGGYEAWTYSQWALFPADGRIYAYLNAKTVVFDLDSRQWKDLKVPSFYRKAHYYDRRPTYGSLAYDPVNKEIISLGGTSNQDGGTPGTWAFNIAANSWKRVPVGSRELKELRGEVKAFRVKAAAFVNVCRNRFYVAETEAEAKADLKSEASALVAEAGKLVKRIKAAKLSGVEAGAATIAAAQLSRARDGLRTLTGKVGGKITSETLLETGSTAAALVSAERALDAEPCGRAASQMATDPVNGKIVLFGGCRMDSYLADTWVYDCKSRTWEQRYPKTCPAPRSGHMLVWLPKSGKVFLAGARPISSGYGVRHVKAKLPQDAWAYDVKANQWVCLARTDPRDLRRHSRRHRDIGAADENDVVVGITGGPSAKKPRGGRITWGMKVDPSVRVAGDGVGVLPGTVAIALREPADYDRVAKPDPGAVDALLKSCAANVWTPMPKPPLAGFGRDYSSASYDPIRHQVLWWGGGHSTWHQNDMAHYSLRTATWSCGYAEEYPYAGAIFNSPVNQSFNNRPFGESHVWDRVAYDPVSDRVVLCNRGLTWTYNPKTRDFEYPPLMSAPGGSYTLVMTSTPKGVVAWGLKGKFSLFDAKARKWRPLPVAGPKPGGPISPSGGMCYDSKRKCLWIMAGSRVFRYELAGGKLERIGGGKKMPALSPRETVYVPEIDMLLCISRIKGAGGQVGNLAFDIEKSRWVVLKMPCTDGKPRNAERSTAYVSSELSYDPAYERVIWVPGSGAVFVARLDKAKLKVLDVPAK